MCPDWVLPMQTSSCKRQCRTCYLQARSSLWREWSTVTKCWLLSFISSRKASHWWNCGTTACWMFCCSELHFWLDSNCGDLLTYIAIFRQQLYDRVTHNRDLSDIAWMMDTTIAFDTSRMLTSAVLSVFVWLIGVKSVVFNDWFVVWVMVCQQDFCWLWKMC